MTYMYLTVSLHVVLACGKSNQAMHKKKKGLEFNFYIEDWFFFLLIVSLRDSIMETCNVVLIFESFNKILWCDYSNETSFVWYHLFFIILQNEIFLLFWHP